MYRINLQYFAKTNKQLEEENAALKAKLLAGVSTEEQEALAAKIVEDAKLEAEKIKAEAEAEAETLKTEAANSGAATNLEDEKTVEEYLEERVPVMLIKDGEKYKDDVVIALNGERIQIQRGRQVHIKRKFAMILESTYRQQMIAADLSTQYEDEFKGREKQLS